MTKFNVGDEVRIIKAADKRSCYKGLCNHTGVVKYIREYRDETTYYLQLSDRVNPAQEQGWFVYDEEDLEFKYDTHDVYSEPPLRAEHAFGVWADEFSTDGKPYIKIKEEKKEMELLDLYFIRKRDELEVKYHEKREKIKRKDVMYTEVMDLRKKYAHIAEFNIYVTNSYKFSTEIETEIIKNDREYDKKLDELYCQKREIEAQLDICETYEQKMNVLKIYNVVDEKGKLNV